MDFSVPIELQRALSYEESTPKKKFSADTSVMITPPMTPTRLFHSLSPSVLFKKLGEISDRKRDQLNDERQLRDDERRLEETKREEIKREEMRQRIEAEQRKREERLREFKRRQREEMMREERWNEARRRRESEQRKRKRDAQRQRENGTHAKQCGDKTCREQVDQSAPINVVEQVDKDSDDSTALVMRDRADSADSTLIVARPGRFRRRSTAGLRSVVCTMVAVVCVSWLFVAEMFVTACLSVMRFV